MAKPISSDAASILSTLADIGKFHDAEKTRNSPLVAEALSHTEALITKLPEELQSTGRTLVAGDDARNALPNEQRQLAEDIRRWSPGPG